MPAPQTDPDFDTSKLSVQAFVARAVTVSDPTAFFAEMNDSGRLENPRATAIEMRRKGFIIDYNEKK